jgi:hypothetical protein
VFGKDQKWLAEGETDATDFKQISTTAVGKHDSASSAPFQNDRFAR